MEWTYIDTRSRYRRDLGYEMDEWSWTYIDTANRMIQLKEHKGNGTFQVPLPRSFDLKKLSCAIQTINLLDILVVCEFSDIFPDKLPGLPPDRIVEFTTELVPRVAPISRRPYTMTPNKLAELKV